MLKRSNIFRELRKSCQEHFLNMVRREFDSERRNLKLPHLGDTFICRKSRTSYLSAIVTIIFQKCIQSWSFSPDFKKFSVFTIFHCFHFRVMSLHDCPLCCLSLLGSLHTRLRSVFALLSFLSIFCLSFL